MWNVAQHREKALSHLQTLDDYLRFTDEMVRWAPRENGGSRLRRDKLVAFYSRTRPPAAAGTSIADSGDATHTHAVAFI